MPTTEQHSATSSDTLHGWKDIAGYLGRSVRSVQRWESELGLPVHRIKAAEGQTVYALRLQIDEWRRSRDLTKLLPDDVAEDDAGTASNETTLEPPPSAHSARIGPGWTWFAVGVAAALAIGVRAGSYFTLNRVGPVASLQTAGTSVVAYDSLGRVAWTHSFGEQISRADSETGSVGLFAPFAGTDQNGLATMFIPVRFSTAGNPSNKSDMLVAFDSTGNIRWQFQPSIKLQCGQEEIRGPWRIHAVSVSTQPGKTRVRIAVNHQTWWPGMIIEIDGTGKSEIKYLQTGWIRALTEWKTPTGTLLAVAGVSNEFQRPSLALVNLDAPTAMTPHSDPRFSCKDQPTGVPSTVYLFPNLDTIGDAPYFFANSLTGLESGLKVGIRDGEGGTVAEIGPDLAVRSFSMTDGHWATHRRLERGGRLNHPAENCPEQTTPQPIDIWTSTTGWTKTTIMPTSRQTVARK